MDDTPHVPPFTEPLPPQEPPAETPPPRPVRSAPGFPSPQRAMLLGSLQVVLSAAVVIATVFTLWNPANLFNNQTMAQALLAWQMQSNNAQNSSQFFPTITAQPSEHIGIVAGHYSKDKNSYDPGAVCEDGLTEQSVNYKITTMVMQKLNAMGYQVDLLAEFDPLLNGYRGQVLVSVHNDSCEYQGDQATGFKVAAAVRNAYPEAANQLTNCLIDRYKRDTGMQFHYNSITNDMTQYHTFNEINSNTPAAIIETGFLNLDRQFLTEQTDRVAQGIVDGITCYLNDEKVDNPTQ
jgi:N-acetylmuramoyl-L-alanine amidase